MKTIKKIKKKQWRAKSTTSIESLPQDLVVEIIAQLVSQSPTPVSDLENLQMTCKMLRTASKTKFVRQSIALEKEWCLHWWNKEHYFAILSSCAMAGNLDAYFILGLENIFHLERLSLGLSYLDKAMVGGHDAATYTLGILFFGDHRTRQIGMEYLNKIEAVSGGTDDLERIKFRNPYVEQCRRQVLESVRRITMKRWSPWQREQCRSPTCGRVEGWETRQSFCSELCKWTFEYFQFYIQM